MRGRKAQTSSLQAQHFFFFFLITPCKGYGDLGGPRPGGGGRGRVCTTGRRPALQEVVLDNNSTRRIGRQPESNSPVHAACGNTSGGRSSRERGVEPEGERSAGCGATRCLARVWNTHLGSRRAPGPRARCCSGPPWRRCPGAARRRCRPRRRNIAAPARRL